MTSLARDKAGDQLTTTTTTTTTPVVLDQSSSPRPYASESWSPLEQSEQSKEDEDDDEKESVVAVVVPPRQAQDDPDENQQQQQQQQQPLADDSGGCFPSRRRQQQRPAKSKPVQQQQHPKDEEQQPHHVDKGLDKGLDKDLSLLAVTRITATARAVKILRGTVLLILILAATLAAIGVYRYTKHEEQVRFETEYQFNSQKLLETFLDAIERRLGAINAMATSFTSHALATNQTFPRFTLPDFGTYIWNINVCCC